jgi:hypothetical protein
VSLAARALSATTAALVSLAIMEISFKNMRLAAACQRFGIPILAAATGVNCRP